MLHPAHLCDLAVDPLLHPRGQAHLSSASGLVRAGDWLHFIADDEHHIGTLPVEAGALPRVQLRRLRGSDLPRDAVARKRAKPDLEALIALPLAPHGALLALGSGSKPNREGGFLLRLDPQGQILQVDAVDLSPLYQRLHAQFADLNIEGAFVSGAHLHLLQRANRGHAGNARVVFPLEAITGWLQGGVAPAPVDLAALDLGGAGGVPYGVTDGAALPDGGWIVSAVAEDTTDSYADGACVGSALAWFDSTGRLQALQPLQRAPKVEGLALAGEGRLLMVTDADDPAQPSQLLQLALDDLRATPSAPRTPGSRR